MSVIEAPVESQLRIPSVPAFAFGDWPATSGALEKGARETFGQFWRQSPEAGFTQGEVRLGRVGDDLVIHARLADENPRNSATRPNEATWMTGDVLEFFFQPEGRAAYYEFHVTPENQRLQLRFPSSAAFHEHREFRHWAIPEPLFESATRISAARDQWEAVLRIPLSLMEPRPSANARTRFRYLLSRYDYQPGKSRPVLSATGRLPFPSFHHIPGWSWAEV